jgi:GR25 family glycosyltransferase involved in LPS biosynthesis
VIEHDLASVFIFEDDADWDIRFLSQLPELAKGVRHLSGVSFTERQHSPYGDDWDIIWPGHCSERPPEQEDDHKYIIENDETVAPKDKQSGIQLLKTYPEGTRIVHKSVAPICTFGYAISYRGAQKILAELAVKGTVWPIDNGLAFLCHDEALGLKCFTVVPQLVQHHRPAGPKSKDSDIEHVDGSSVRKKGSTETIVLSARLNIEQLIRGTEDWIKQW